MSDLYKLGLSRSRLFEFDNCVCLSAELPEKYEKREIEIAFKKLSFKEPILSSKVILREDGEAFVQITDAEAILQQYDGDAETFFFEKRSRGIDPSEKLFEANLCENVFMLFGHTCVCDGKSLLILLKELLSFLSGDSVSVEPSEIKLISECSDFPFGTSSPIIDKVTAACDDKWHNSRIFSFDDYRAASKKFFEKQNRGHCHITLSEKETGRIKEKSAKENVDPSTYICYAFEKSADLKKGKKNYNEKVIFQTDIRFFFENFETFAVGPFNAYAAISAFGKPKEGGELVGLQKNRYKKATSLFQSVYNELLLMNLSPSLCDAAYMTAAGEFSNKTALKTAKNYGCMNKKSLEFVSFNLDQKYWEPLGVCGDMTVLEPFKRRSDILLSAVERNGVIRIFADYDKTVHSDADFGSYINGMRKYFE